MAHGNFFENSINGSSFICCTCTITGMVYLLDILIEILNDSHSHMTTNHISNSKSIAFMLYNTPLNVNINLKAVRGEPIKCITFSTSTLVFTVLVCYKIGKILVKCEHNCDIVRVLLVSSYYAMKLVQYLLLVYWCKTICYCKNSCHLWMTISLLF